MSQHTGCGALASFRQGESVASAALRDIPGAWVVVVVVVVVAVVVVVVPAAGGLHRKASLWVVPSKFENKCGKSVGQK